MGEFLTFLFVVGAGGVGWYYFDTNRKNEELATRQSELNDARANVEEMRKRVDSRRREVGGLQQKVTQLDTLEKEKATLETQMPDVERELASRRTELATAVREERSKAAGTTHSELRLVDGEVLTDVRIVSVSDSDISVAHAGGVARVPAKRLPADFQQRFRFGMDLAGATGSAQGPSSSVAAQPASPPTATSIEPVPATGSPRLTDSHRTRVDSLNAALLTKKNRLLALEQLMAREGAAERNAQSQRQKPLPSDPERLSRQLERDKKQKDADQMVKFGVSAARLREMEVLQKEIADIQTQITVLNQGGQ